jgi:hypothetical protein
VERYASMQTEELVALHSAGTLLDDAYPILELELARRGVAVGPRPAQMVPPPELTFFAGHWSGAQSASSANLFVAAVVPALLALCLSMAYRLAHYLTPESRLVELLPPTFAIAMLGYSAFAAVAIWRCARNEGSARSIAMVRFRGFRLLAIFVVGALFVLGKSI